MLLRLDRVAIKDAACFGVLRIDGEPECFTLEDEPRAEKVAGSTAIPAGRYELKLRPFGGVYERYRVRFPWNAPGMLELLDVPGFEDVLVHCGNTVMHTAGCVLVGDKVSIKGILEDSAPAYRRVYTRALDVIRRHKLFLEVFDVSL